MRKRDKSNVVFRISILLLILLCLVYYGYRLIIKQQYEVNHEMIAEFINVELDYSPEEIDNQKNRIEEYLKLKYLYDADRGWLYERLSLIYQTNEDSVQYYDAIGKALYYLEQGGDYNHAANIYADLSNFFYTHSEDVLAQDMLTRVSTNIDKITDFQVKSYVYRLQAMLDIKNGNYNEAYKNINNSDECIYADGRGVFYQGAYIAINSVVKARCAFMAGDYAECRKLIEDYKESVYLTPTAYVEVSTRDFVIPYYEVASLISIYDNDDIAAAKNIDMYISKCTEYGYRNLSLELMNYIQTTMSDKLGSNEETVNNEIHESYKTVNEDLYRRYALLIDSQIQFSRQSEISLNEASAQTRDYTRNVLFITATTIVIILLMINVVLKSSSDGLTRVGNRRALDKKLDYYNRTGRHYSVIMIDIDDFKKVNDTYGHDVGDKVLTALGSILNEVKKVGYIPYRYGGEEFLFLIDGTNTTEIVKMADHLRYLVENQRIDGLEEKYTISLGVASKTDGNTDVVKLADENLYYSKQHGKNVVTYLDEGVQTLYGSNSTI